MTRADGTPCAASALIGSSRGRYPGTMRAPTNAALANALGPATDANSVRTFMTSPYVAARVADPSAPDLRGSPAAGAGIYRARVLPTPPVLADDLVRPYLARIGADAAPPSIVELRALHQAHAAALSHESTWIHLGDEWDIDPSAAVARFVGSGRGGYCYHLNGGFASLLRTLGYDVTMHLGAVHGPDGPTDGLGNHMVLQVTGLPDDANPGGRWYADVGLGEGLLEPMPLVPGAYRQEPIGYELARAPENAPAEHGDWRLRIDHPHCNVKFVAFDSTPVSLDAFAAHHVEQSTAPTSMFVSLLLAHRRDATGVDSLIGLVLARVEADRTQQVLETPDDWFAALADVFGVSLLDVDAERRDALWRTTLATHEAWSAG
jgi:N-hydroxyarylamine O-acetyltransferase